MPTTADVYAIAKWDTVFERAESRKLKQLTWVAMPTGFQSNGYQSMLDDFGDDAAACYGCWCALVAFASSCAVRGVLASSRGIPLKISHIARQTGLSAEMFERLVAWAASERIGWLEVLSAEQIDATFFGLRQDDPPSEPTRPEKHGKLRENNTSGESPDDPPACQGLPPSTLPNTTRPNQTGPNLTKPDQTKPSAAAARAAAAEVNFDFVDPPVITEAANRLLRALEQARIAPLPPEWIWDMSAIAERLSPGLISDVATKIRNGQVRTPKAYLEGALRKECEAVGTSLRELRPLVPPRPQLREPPPETAVTTTAARKVAREQYQATVTLSAAEELAMLRAAKKQPAKT